MLNLKRISGLSVAGLVLALLCIPMAPARAQDAGQASEALYSRAGTADCMKCHDTAIVEPDRTYKAVSAIFQTPHAMKGDARTPFAAHECESCHGPSEAHVTSTVPEGQKKTMTPIVFSGPDASPVSEQNKACIGCHQNGLRMDWAGSQHQNANLACVSCHTIHVAKDPVLIKATQPDVCFTCHAEQRAQSLEFSHHPIREGKVVCSDCHNPHGSVGPRLLKEVSITDTCVTCHADKRGPFLWEHEPVREDCTNCHTPHGSTQARLLKQRPPFLCTSCHNTGGHNSNPFSASNLPTGSALTDARAVSTRLLARGCVNCHSQIHGSNSPSGSFFTR